MEKSSLHIVIFFRGKTFPCDVSPSQTFLEFSQLIEDQFGITKEYQKLIVSGKNIRKLATNESTLQDLGIKNGDKLMLVGTSSNEVDIVQKSKSDPLVRTFEQEKEIEERRRNNVVSRQQTNPYIENFEVLQQFNTPPPYVALNLLKKLAADPGIIAIMKKHSWRVGLLKEMPPVGKVGISEVCVLGLNTNKGQTISLRLRTDDLKGIRNYNTIKEVFLHELTHNEHSEHDDNFWTLFRQLKREAEVLDWTKQGGHSISGNYPSQNESAFIPDKGNVLGGSKHPTSARSMAAEAALKRFASQKREDKEESQSKQP